jgi:hypothetical protein
MGGVITRRFPVRTWPPAQHDGVREPECRRGIPTENLTIPRGADFQPEVSESCYAGVLPWLETGVELGLQISRGFAASHGQGVLHRDIKPANILLEHQTGRAVLTDFGLALIARSETLTASGVVGGTLSLVGTSSRRSGRITAGTARVCSSLLLNLNSGSYFRTVP